MRPLECGGLLPDGAQADRTVVAANELVDDVPEQSARGRSSRAQTSADALHIMQLHRGDTIGHVEVKGDIEGFVLVDGGGVDVERIEAAKQAPKS